MDFIYRFHSIYESLLKADQNQNENNQVLLSKDKVIFKNGRNPVVILQKYENGWIPGNNFLKQYPDGHILKLFFRDPEKVVAYLKSDHRLRFHLETLQIECKKISDTIVAWFDHGLFFGPKQYIVIFDQKSLFCWKMLPLDILVPFRHIKKVKQNGQIINSNKLRFQDHLLIFDDPNQNKFALFLQKDDAFSDQDIVFLRNHNIPFFASRKAMIVYLNSAQQVSQTMIQLSDGAGLIKLDNENRFKPLHLIVGQMSHSLMIDIESLPSNRKWDVFCYANESTPILLLVGTNGTNQNNSTGIEKEKNSESNSHDPSTQTFSAQQPLGHIQGYFDSQGNLVRVGSKKLSNFDSKYVAYGYKICSSCKIPNKKWILSLDQMVLVKLGFTSNDRFNLYSKQGKIRASSADVVAMARIVPVASDKRIVKLVCDIKKARSVYDPHFVYLLGRRVSVDFFSNREIPECGYGVHFFWDPMKALSYKYPHLGYYRVHNLEKFSVYCFNLKEDVYTIMPSHENEVASLIQFFWRLRKARLRFSVLASQNNSQNNPENKNTFILQDIVRYWQEITKYSKTTI